MTQYLGLSDLTGNTSGPFNVGFLSAALDPNKGAWPGNNPIDWWFLADHTTVDSSGLPTGQMNANLTSHALTGGPNDVSISLSLGGGPAVLKMRSASIAATIGSATDAPAPPPTNIDPSLTVFETVDGTPSGEGLCGDITVDSLAQIPIPQALTTGSTACGACSGSRTYTYCGANNPVSDSCNSLLDALVGGCKVPIIGCFISATVINATQPDVPAAGGSVQTLTFSGIKIPSSETTGDEDAYSSYLTFQANRAHFTGETCSQASDCQASQSCASARCQ
jgi:hypothetical protein